MSDYKKIFGDELGDKISKAFKNIRRFMRTEENPSKEDIERCLEDNLGVTYEEKEEIIERVMGQLDNGLREFGGILINKLGGKDIKRYYVVKSECEHCDDVHKDVIECGDYITERQFLLEGYLNGQYKTTCEKCKKPLMIKSSVNLVEIKDSKLTYAIQQRIKSRGRLSQKLTDLICFGNKDILDIAGTTIVLYDLEGMNTKERKELKNYLIEKFGKSIDLNTKNLNSELCDYVYHRLLELHFEIDLRDDYFAQPKERKRDGRIERYEAKHYIVMFKKNPIELQIKTKTIYDKERDNRSPLCHDYYAKRENERRKEQWKEKHYYLCASLEKLFSRK